MIVQSKKLIPEIYSNSYDFSIFTGLLDLIYTARDLNALRAQVSHCPQHCFKEDLPSLASLFNLPVSATRDLLQYYRLLIKQKGTFEAVVSAAAFASSISSSSSSLYISDARIDIQHAVYYKNGDPVVKDIDTRTIYIKSGKRAPIVKSWSAPRGRIAKETTKVTIYLDFTNIDYAVFDTLIQRLAPVGSQVVLRKLAEASSV